MRFNRFKQHFQPPTQTEAEIDTLLKDKQVHFVFDFANTFISAERLGYEVDFAAITERFPKITKDVFITQRDLINYGRLLKGYQVHASPGKNCDVEITLYLNSLTANNKLKSVCFFGGDGDFQPVLALLQERRIAVQCLSFASSFSTRLLSVSEFIPLGQDFLKPIFKKEVKRYA